VCEAARIGISNILVVAMAACRIRPAVELSGAAEAARYAGAREWQLHYNANAALNASAHHCHELT
jgi:hypothetical protein